MVSVSRRSLLAVLGGGVVSGCLQGENQRGGKLYGEPVNEPPEDVEPIAYPADSHKNPYITEVVQKVAEQGGVAEVRIPAEDFEAVNDTYWQYTQEGVGTYVRYNDTVVKLRLAGYE